MVSVHELYEALGTEKRTMHTLVHCCVRSGHVIWICGCMEIQKLEEAPEVGGGGVVCMSAEG